MRITSFLKGLEAGAGLRHYLGTGVLALLAYELITTAFWAVRLAAGIAIALGIWYLINPGVAASRLSALWQLLAG